MALDPKYPSTSDELGRMFKISPGDAIDNSQTQSTGPMPANLPVAEAESEPVGIPAMEQLAQLDNVTHNVVLHVSPAGSTDQSINQPTVTAANSKVRARFNVAKKAVPYLIVFVVGLLLYYFYFSDFSFSKLFSGRVNAPVVDVSTTVDNSALAALKKQEATHYATWIGQFFFMADSSITDMDADVSGNGLTNFQKYLLNLNPKAFDTQGTGQADGLSVINGLDPWTGQSFKDAQKKLIASYFDTELVSNRISAATANRSTSIASLYGNNSGANQIAGQNINQFNPDQLADLVAKGAVAGASVGSQQTQVRSTVNRQAPVTGVNNVIGQNSLGIDTNIPGTLNIPDLKVSVPLIWTKNSNNFEQDLKKGVVYYPGTALPGDIGTSYISGHSNGYVFDYSPYKRVFASLGNLKDGASFTITVTLQGGKKAVLHYVVDRRAEFAADDQAQFAQTPDSTVALSTCWPVNTTARRLVLFSRLTQVEK